MRIVSFLLLLAFTPLQGVAVLFCPFEADGKMAGKAGLEAPKAVDGAGEDAHHHPSHDHSSHGHHPTTAGGGTDEAPGTPTGGTEHHGHGEECVAMAACSAPVAPAEDPPSFWVHPSTALQESGFRHPAPAHMHPDDPPPPRIG